MVVEGALAPWITRPDQRSWALVKRTPREVGHGIGLDPDDVVEDPIARSCSSNRCGKICVGTMTHSVPVSLRTGGKREPIDGEIIVVLEAIEMVPTVVTAPWSCWAATAPGGVQL